MPALFLLNRCDANLDLVNIQGVDVEVVKQFRSMNFIAGSFEAFRDESAAAVVGKELAKRRGWRLGQAAEINGITFNIRGIYEDNGSIYESIVLVHLNFLQLALGQGRDSFSTQVYVKVDDVENAGGVATLIDKAFQSDANQTDTKPEKAFMVKGLRTFEEVIDFSMLLGYIAVFVILILVVNTLYMSIQDRIKEIAVLRTLGFSPSRIAMMMILESMVICLIGGIIGAASIYVVLFIKHFGLGIGPLQINFKPSLTVQGGGVIVAVCIGFLAGLISNFSIIKLNIVEGLRKV